MSLSWGHQVDRRSTTSSVHSPEKRGNRHARLGVRRCRVEVDRSSLTAVSWHGTLNWTSLAGWASLERLSHEEGDHRPSNTSHGLDKLWEELDHRSRWI